MTSKMFDVFLLLLLVQVFIMLNIALPVVIFDVAKGLLK